MDEPVNSPKYSLFDWIAGTFIVLGATLFGFFVAAFVGLLIPRGFPGSASIGLCIASIPVVWIAKRSGALQKFSWWALPILCLAMIVNEVILNAFRVPLGLMHILTVSILGIGASIAARLDLMPRHDHDSN